jgi:putative tryptophan/tyrosine transport system substrate-binding protein
MINDKRFSGWVKILTAIVFILPGVRLYAEDSKIIVVLSADAEPYQQAKKALADRLGKESFTLQTALLDDVMKDYDQTANEAKAFVGIGTKAAVWLHGRIKPPTKLIYCMVSDLESNHLDAEPKAYGVSTDVPLSCQFGLIQAVLPRAQSVGILYQSNNEKSRRTLAGVNAELPKTWRVEAVAIDQYDSIAKAIEAMLAKPVDIVWTSPDPAIYDVGTTRSLLLSAMRSNKPVFGFSPACVRAGALMGVGIEPAKQGTQAAEILIALLRNESEKNVDPIQKPKFEIAVNLIVAEKLSVSISDSLIKQATYVFEAKK